MSKTRGKGKGGRPAKARAQGAKKKPALAASPQQPAKPLRPAKPQQPAKAGKSLRPAKPGPIAKPRTLAPPAKPALVARPPAPIPPPTSARGAKAPRTTSAAVLPRAEIVSAPRAPWSVAPTLGWFAAATVLAVLAIDGDLDAVVELVHPDGTAAVAAATPGVGPSGPAAEDTPPPPLPPPPDLAPIAPVVAGAPPPPQPGVTLEEGCADPAATACARYALDTVYAALAATEAGTATRPVRIAFYGDSVSAADAIPGRIRARLQEAFGDGGPGFLHAIAPHRYNYSLQVERTSSGTWTSWNAVQPRTADDLYGVGLATAEGHGTLRWRMRDPTRHYTRAELYYLAHPRGGSADLIVDGEVAASLDTAADVKTAAFQVLALDDREHELDLKTTRGKVRLFGVTLERERGVVVDNLAMVSATAAKLRNNREDHWRDQLAHRAADLVVFMIGTNEAQWLAGSRAMSEYEQEWAAVLAPVRAARPDASCLVLAPLDQAETQGGKLVPRRAMPRMIAAQRRAAQAAGCAFWDNFTWMGGSGSAIKWNRRGLLGSDFAHPSPQGMARVADAVTDALIAGYRAYKGRTPP